MDSADPAAARNSADLESKKTFDVGADADACRRANGWRNGWATPRLQAAAYGTCRDPSIFVLHSLEEAQVVLGCAVVGEQRSNLAWMTERPS